jgi:hypothetical protein
MEEETLGKIIWSYPSAKDVWANCSRKLQRTICEEEEFFLIFERIMKELTKGKAQFFAIVAWQIWLQKNKLVFGGDLTHP